MSTSAVDENREHILSSPDNVSPQESNGSQGGNRPGENNGRFKLPSVSDRVRMLIRTGSMESVAQQVFSDERLPQSGYRRLATKMGDFASEISLFRKFGDLNMLNLLSLQAELMNLHFQLKWACEQEMDEVDDPDSKFETSDLPALSGFNFEELMKPEQDENGKVTTYFAQWDIILQIRAKLKEYSK
jgi:uncharacterized protein DUF6594